ncbi:MAG: TonB-dependent receptor [Cytophagales bacterium]|nr:TonB-dependent receptor [Cytophagales bacterium]
MKISYLLMTLVLCLAFEVRAQNIQITGSVTSSEDEAGLPGVNVIVQGTSTGTVTDVDGNYTLEVPGIASVLVFSSVGYIQEEVAVGSRTVIDMVMTPDVTALEEIVVVGYGTMKKSDLTGSLTSVSSDDYQVQPITRIDQALQGRAAGVAVTQTSGAPGAGYKIRIRGANSISGNNAPLYVVDGLVVGDINSINVNDIASMEVLKDASATAIYGSRGANGVVLITTKSGSQGPAKIEVETFYGVSQVTQKLPAMTPAEFAEGVNFAEGTEFYTPEEIADLRNGGGEDWHERFFREAPFANLQLSVSGGSDAVDYFVSGNLYNADGTLRSQNYNRYAIRTNINAEVSKKIGLGLNAYFSREEETGVRANLYQGLTWDPTTPAYNEEGDYNFVPLKPGVGNGAINQLVAPENNVRENFNHQVLASGYFKYNILNDLELNISGGVERLDRNNNSYTSILVNQVGTAKVYNQDVTRFQNTNRLTYTWNKNPNHRLQIDAIHEQQYVKAQGVEAEASGFFSDNTSYKNLGLGAIQRTASKAYSNGTNNPVSESLQSFLGRVNYSLFERFLFTASIRADGSSKFAENNRWGYFPSGSFAYRISDEAFIQGIEVIDNLKLRVSYGQIGSQAIEPLARRAIPIIDTSVSYPFEGEASTIGVAPSNRLANPDLTWETTTQGNIGFDIGLWNSRLTFSLDLYQKKTTDLLLDRVLPSYVGPTVVTQNVGEVENKGFDLRLGMTLVDNDDWHVSSILSVSKNKNKVLALVDEVELMELGKVYQNNTFPVNPTAVQLGKPISTFRGYIFEGVYQKGEEDEAALYGKVPGQARYKDINGDTLISSDDIVTVGDGNPDFTWGWNWTVSWRKLDLNFLVLGAHGNDIYNFTRMRMMGLGAAQFHAVHADYNDRWTENNPSEIPSGRDGTEFLSSQFIEDGSFVSMKNITLGYNFDFSGSSFIETLRLYVSAENLFIITDYSGFDPEATASGSSDVDLGIDLNAYPINRAYSIGLKFMF